MGSNGQQLGCIRLGFRVAKPIDDLLLAQHQQEQQHQQQQADATEGQEPLLLEEHEQHEQEQEPDLEQAAALALQQAAEQVGSGQVVVAVML